MGPALISTEGSYHLRGEVNRVIENIERNTKINIEIKNRQYTMMFSRGLASIRLKSPPSILGFKSFLFLSGWTKLHDLRALAHAISQLLNRHLDLCSGGVYLLTPKCSPQYNSISLPQYNLKTT